MRRELGRLSDTQRATANDWLRKAEEACRDLKADQANAILDQLEGRLWAWRHLGQDAAKKTRPRAAEAAAGESAGEPRPAALWVEGVEGWPRRAPGVLRFLVLSVTQPAVHAALVVALAVAALLVLYVENPTFGGKADWLPLIGWGFVTDPVSAALSNLRGRSTS
jgi:hypothetical protein